MAALLDQARSPLIGILALGAGLSLFLGAVVDAAIIGGTIVASVAINTWQENKANKTTEMLQSLAASNATVVRDGQIIKIPASVVVPGDILLLATGDRVAADARIITAGGLEVDEASLTGESCSCQKWRMEMMI